jgi:hypothetical protein
LTRLQKLLAAMDDDALASLASKGLVRRAKKDLQTMTPEILGVEDDRVRLQVGEYEVTVPEVPANATSTSPATGICRHILAALIFLRDSAEEEPADVAAAMEAARRELASLDDDVLQRWAGSARFRRALKNVSAGIETKIEEKEAIVIRLPARNIVCRWLPGGGLESMVCSGPSGDARVDGLLAVLAYQVAIGARQVEYEQTVLDASTQAPRTRDEVLASLGAILQEMVGLGLSRLSVATENRLRTLAVSAHGVDLPRLVRLIRALGDEVALMLRRDAQAATANLLATAARIEALRCALRRPNAVLVGRHRSNYEAVGNIQLVGMGARQWQTRSGYRGLTVYFWDGSCDNWATWTDARPVSVGSFDPASRYRQDGPWEGCTSPSKASRSVLRLTGAWRNPVGRLSGRPSTKAIVTSDSAPARLPQAVCQWPELWRRATALFGGGLGERSEQDEIVFIQPSAWHTAEYDRVAQRLVRPVVDRQGHPINLTLAYHEQLTAEAIDLLQQYDPAANRGILGLIRFGAGELFVEPVSLCEDERIVNLSLDRTEGSASKSRSGASSAAPREEEPSELAEDVADGETEEMVPSGSATAVGVLLTTTLTELEAVAEGGVTAARDTESLARLADRSEGLGLTCCAVAVKRLLDQLREARKSPDQSARGPAAEALLHAYYVTSLASQQESIAAAVPALPM